MKQKEYTCGYSDCLHKGEKVPSEIAVKDGTRYYHPDCHTDKTQRNQIFDIYYKYYKSTEDYAMVRKAIKGFCNTSSTEYVLYVLCQSIHKKKPLKSIFSLGWIAKNEQEFKKSYAVLKAKRDIKDIDFEGVETVKADNTAEYRNTNTGRNWADTLFS